MKDFIKRTEAKQPARNLWLRANAKAFLIFALIVGAIMGATYYSNKPFYDLINDDGKQLFCELKNGFQIIEKSKIKAYEGDYWVFTNGYATNCQIRKIN